eukprot:166516-Pyramimonas_sp.AAC.1
MIYLPGRGRGRAPGRQRAFIFRPTDLRAKSETSNGSEFRSSQQRYFRWEGLGELADRTNGPASPSLLLL